MYLDKLTKKQLINEIVKTERTLSQVAIEDLRRIEDVKNHIEYLKNMINNK